MAPKRKRMEVVDLTEAARHSSEAPASVGGVGGSPPKKLKVSHVYEEEEIPPAVRPTLQSSCVWVCGMRYSKKADMDIKDFKAAQVKLHATCQQYAKKFVYQLEKTEVKDEKGSHDNWHYQGYLNLKEKRRPKALAILLNEQFPGINIQPASANGKEALKSYCMKEDTRVDGPWSDQPSLKHDDIKVIKESPFPYQRLILDEVKGEPHHRKINWVVDTVGGHGKSSFAKFIYVNQLGLALTYGRTSDLFNLVFKMPKQRFYLFDLSRTKPKDFHTDDVYAALEGIKNGYVVNTKYETGVWVNDPSHVWVFSNYPPLKERMSSDRWVVYYMRGDHTMFTSLPPPAQSPGTLPVIDEEEDPFGTFSVQ